MLLALALARAVKVGARLGRDRRSQRTGPATRQDEPEKPSANGSDSDRAG
jgi:hypothetical protein